MVLNPRGPVEAKVSAATVAAAVSGLIVWVLQNYVFRGEVPFPVSSAVQVIVPALFAFVAGWCARHTPRPDLAGGEPAAGAVGDPPGDTVEFSSRDIADARGSVVHPDAAIHTVDNSVDRPGRHERHNLP